MGDDKKETLSIFKTDKQARILVADDDKFYLQIYSDLLNELGCEYLCVENGLELVEKAGTYNPDLIITDVMMPGMDGFEAAKRLRRDPLSLHIPILMVTMLADRESRVEGLEDGADEFLSKPIDKMEFRIRIKNMLKMKQYENFLMEHSKVLEGEVIDKSNQLKEAFAKIKKGYTETIYRLTLAAEYRDKETGEHIKRMALYAQTISRYLKMDEPKVELLFFASPMHDVGKVGIPDQILLKPRKLTAEEFEVMKTHTTIGGRILRGSDSEILKTAEEIALTHHERWDGSGYPSGLKGEEIPMSGRIVHIVDTYDAIRSKRPYKSPMDHNTACDAINKSRELFDPVILDAFRICHKEFKRLFDENRD